MPRPIRERKTKEKPELPEYTNRELWALNNLLKEKYNNGNKPSDITQWLIDEGALSIDGAVIYNDNPCLYEILQDKLNKANKLLGRKEFAIRKEMEELSEKLTIDF